MTTSPQTDKKVGPVFGPDPSARRASWPLSCVPLAKDVAPQHHLQSQGPWKTSLVSLPGSMGRHWAFALSLAVASVRCAVSEMAGTYTMTEVLDWQRKSEMQMLISASEGDPVPLSYTVIPLTTNLGLNESQLARGVGNTTLTHSPSSPVCH